MSPARSRTVRRVAARLAGAQGRRSARHVGKGYEFDDGLDPAAEFDDFFGMVAVCDDAQSAAVLTDGQPFSIDRHENGLFGIFVETTERWLDRRDPLCFRDRAPMQLLLAGVLDEQLERVLQNSVIQSRRG